MSVLGTRDSGYTAKYGLNPREFPRAVPSGTPLGSGHISPYIPRLLLIRIQYSLPTKIATTLYWFFIDYHKKPFKFIWKVLLCYFSCLEQGSHSSYISLHTAEEHTFLQPFTLYLLSEGKQTTMLTKHQTGKFQHQCSLKVPNCSPNFKCGHFR